MSYISYIRVSSKKQNRECDQNEEGKGLSLSAQERLIKDYASRHDLEISEWYSDVESGQSTNRQGFCDALKKLGNSKVQGIIFHKIDRSARNMHDFAKLDSFLDGKDIRFVEGEFKTDSPAGRLALRIMCNFAVYFSENLSHEVKKGQTESLRRGRYPHRPKFGYERTNRPGIHQPNPKAMFIRLAFELYDSGCSINNIVEKLNKRGLRNTVSKPATPSLIQRILRDHYYCGKISWKSKLYDGDHHPLVSSEIFQRVQERLDGKRQRKTRSHLFTYSGLIRCSCGTLLVGDLKTGRHGRGNYIYWKCRTKGCTESRLKDETLDQSITEFIAHCSEKIPQVRSALEDALKNSTEYQADLMKEERQKTEQQIERLQTQLTRVTTGYIEGLYDHKEAATEKERILQQITDLRNGLNTSERNIEAKFMHIAVDVVETFKNLENKYFGADSLSKRLVLEIFLSKLSLTQGKLLFEPSSLVEKAQNFDAIPIGRAKGN